MKHISRYVAGLLLMAAATASAALTALTPAHSSFPSRGEELEDSLTTDTTAEDTTEHIYYIHTTVRNYGDSVRLRWAPDAYVAWRMLQRHGVDVLRVEWGDELTIDTLAHALKPLTVEQFQARYAETDSMAMAAAEVIHGDRTTLDQTEAAPNTLGSIYEVYEEQQNIYGMGMLVAEFRPDLADAMALAFTDRHVPRGHRVEYIVRSCVPDTLLNILGVEATLPTEKYQPEEFHVELTDSLLPPTGIQLYWQPGHYTAYAVERRRKGEATWQMATDKPYVSIVQDEADQPNMFVDNHMEPGTYEYRLRGYDSFGDLTEAGPVLTVTLPDLMAPMPPTITFIDVHRLGDLMTADFYIEKDEFEPDLVGYKFYYHNSKLTGDEWKLLNPDSLMQPRDTMMTVNITGLDEGTVVVAAVDTAGNVAQSMPVTMHLQDITPPEPPTNLRSAATPRGEIILAWTPSVSEDVKGYQVFWANDTTHTFLLKQQYDLIADTIFTDVISMKPNQRYIYYKVKAVDYAGNSSDFTPILERSRPNFTPPRPCRADSMWQTTDSLYTRWIAAAEADVCRYRLYRRLGGDGTWQLVGERTDRDVRNNRLVFADGPDYDRNERYYYAMECLNETGCSSGLSQALAFDHRGPDVVNIPITLYAQMRHPDDPQRKAEERGELVEAASKDGKDQLKLVWEVGKIPADMPGYYFVLFRRSTDQLFRGVQTLKQNVSETTDYRTLRGERAEYYVKIRFEDGRESTPSNIVVVDNK